MVLEYGRRRAVALKDGRQWAAAFEDGRRQVVTLDVCLCHLFYVTDDGVGLHLHVAF